MLFLFGIIIVVCSVAGGFVLAHGELASLWQPFELLIIGGGAFGAFLIANTSFVIKEVFRKIPLVFFGYKYQKSDHIELLKALYAIYNKCRREGLMSIELDLDEPHQSSIFNKYPNLLKEKELLDFLIDNMRILVTGNMQTYELETQMDLEIEARNEELDMSAQAVGRVADALPGFGIIAAVMGIVITMKTIGGTPEELGSHVAAALVGTFLGVLLAYGLVGPMGIKLSLIAQEEIKLYECIKSSLVATANGLPPTLAVEFGRKSLHSSKRPGFTQLENLIRRR